MVTLPVTLGTTGTGGELEQSSGGPLGSPAQHLGLHLQTGGAETQPGTSGSLFQQGSQSQSSRSRKDQPGSKAGEQTRPRVRGGDQRVLQEVGLRELEKHREKVRKGSEEPVGTPASRHGSCTRARGRIHSGAREAAGKARRIARVERRSSTQGIGVEVTGDQRPRP